MGGRLAPETGLGEINGDLLEADFWPTLQGVHDKREFRVLEIREELKTFPK
jgi:hypothetical protein